MLRLPDKLLFAIEAVVGQVVNAGSPLVVIESMKMEHVVGAAAAGQQTALLAPTELLARQHAATAERLLRSIGVHTALLIGGDGVAARRAARERAASGDAALVVGTHALFAEATHFAALGLVIVDEQHRFGVEERARLLSKGSGEPHLLLMTATPIPRTLALSVFGDLELSLLDELPPGRQPIRTILVRPERRGESYEYLRAQVKSGRQAFVIFPLVEESERVEARAATAEFEGRLGHGERHALTPVAG